MLKKNIFLIFCSLCFVLCFPVFSQDNVERIKERSDDSILDDNNSSESVYIINSFNYVINGYTRPNALIYHGELAEGEEITGLSNLQKYIRDKQQQLYNQRVLESVRIEHTIGDERSDGKYPVDLVIYVKDTWNIAVLPRPKFDSNTGIDITLKARDYNFLGTMSPLRVDLGYQLDQDGKQFITTMIDSDIPFRLFGLYWNVDFDNYYTYRPNLDKPQYFRNNTGLSVELPAGNTVFNIGFTESFFINQENPVRYREEYGRFHDGFYMSTNLYISWKIPTGLVHSDLGEVTYTPRLSAVFIHEFPQWPLPDFRNGPLITFSHNLTFGRINWIGNFQSGLNARISNSAGYNFFKLSINEQPWSTNITLRGTLHKILNNFMGISTQLMYRHYFFDDYNDEAADALRGILDNKIKANYMISFNLDIPFRVLQFRPSEWKAGDNFHKVLRIFDFDMHVIPVIDASIFEYNNSDGKNQKAFGPENFLLSGGLEVIIFPERWRSLFLRISYGMNFSPGMKKFTDEIFIGTDLHY